MVTVKSKQSLKGAIFSGEDEIKVDDPELAKWIIAIYAIKQVAWCAAIVVVAAGLYTLIGTGGVGAPITAGLTASAAGIVGFSGASAMVGLGVAMGGIAGLKLLRNDYKITEKTSNTVTLKKK
ncbi:hypothetical protein KIP00_16685 [Vibrio sp. B513a]|uniref:Uncharacterized protein n=2 Tax=Vibrio parahaemolyticus TaxID=670 RepID=A0AAW3IRP8_VIBPH|nr:MULTISPECIES: hypothetical protein [Vibrio]EGQ9194737.1 hypothetical protein [Vibrio parahaemolyticus]EGR3356070.1 hypothetical protein [Vibrio parahaemolyticus]EHK2864572.1 hypothetical protein [Vibrio parahaemolyticus]EHK9101354.1 hypothetical protein [Vibrio parahaemolyticus]EHR6436486.1 hypothetical protein [Vibrio parahaemolyticus]